MGPAALEGVGPIAIAEIRAVGFVAEVRGVVEATKEQEEIDWISTLALSLETLDRA